MLQIVGGPVLRTDDYCIIHNANGVDELRWKVSLSDPDYALLVEEMRVFETTERQLYKITFMDAATKDCSIVATLDLDDFKTIGDPAVYIGFVSGLKKVNEMVSTYCLVDGWELTGATPKSQKCNIEMQGPTRFDILMQCQERFNCAFRFRNTTTPKTITLVYPDDVPLFNGYLVDTVNIRSVPMFRGKSDGLYTRIYPIGKDGLTIESVSQGHVMYLDDNSYTGKIITKVWIDNRFDNAQSLYDAALQKLKEAAHPVRSWTVDVVDLNAIDPAKWPDLDLSIFRRVRLVDNYKGVAADVSIMQTKSYPYYPERNVISVSTVARSVKKSISYLTEQIDDQNSALWQKIGG